MNRMLQRVKKGESAVLGYALLVVLAIGMAAAVYSFLKFQVPKNQPQCPEGVSLAVTEANCSEKEFRIILQNKGLFSINGSYIKIGEKGRVYKDIINCPGPQQHPPACQILFNTGRPSYLPEPLAPGESWYANFSYTLGPGEKEVEIEPLMVIGKGVQAVNRSRILCPDSVITTTVRCT